MVRDGEDKRPKTLKTSQIPVISHPDVSRRRALREFQSANTRDLIAHDAGQDGDPNALLAHSCQEFRCFIAARISRSGNPRRARLDRVPGYVRELPCRSIVGDQPETCPVAIFGVRRLLGDVDVVPGFASDTLSCLLYNCLEVPRDHTAIVYPRCQRHARERCNALDWQIRNSGDRRRRCQSARNVDPLSASNIPRRNTTVWVNHDNLLLHTHWRAC